MAYPDCQGPSGNNAMWSAYPDRLQEPECGQSYPAHMTCRDPEESPGPLSGASVRQSRMYGPDSKYRKFLSFSLSARSAAGIADTECLGLVFQFCQNGSGNLCHHSHTPIRSFAIFFTRSGSAYSSSLGMLFPGSVM